MNKTTILIIILIVIILISVGIYLIASKKEVINKGESEFEAQIVTVSERLILVEVLKTTEAFNESDQVSVKLLEINNFNEVGQKVKITFNGDVLLSYPPQIIADKIELLD